MDHSLLHPRLMSHIAATKFALQCLCKSPITAQCPCGLIGYCGTECQASDWHVHKLICQRNSPKTYDTTTLHMRHIRDIPIWIAEHPDSRQSLNLEMNRSFILENNPFIDPAFQVFARAMRDIVCFALFHGKLPHMFTERARLWYNISQWDKAGKEYEWSSEVDVPLLPIRPLNRSYLEILQWMETESSTELLCGQFKIQMERVARYFADMEQLTLSPSPAGLEIQQEYNAFYYQTLEPWIQELEALTRTGFYSEQKTPTEMLFVRTRGQLQYHDLSIQMNDLQPLSKWLLFTMLTQSTMRLRERCSLYKDTFVANPQQTADYRIMPHNRQVFWPIWSATPKYYREQLNTPWLVKGYYETFHVQSTATPAQVMAMHHDLQLRNFYYQHSNTNHLWTFYCLMFESNPDSFDKDKMVALTAGLRSNHFEWWYQLKPTGQALAQSMVLAIAQGMFKFLEQWRTLDYSLYVSALLELHYILTEQRNSPEFRSEKDLCHYLFYYAVVFQQLGVLQWLHALYPTFEGWNDLLPTHLLIAQVALIPYDVTILNSSHKVQVIQHLETKYRILSQMDQQLQVINKEEFQSTQEMGHQILLYILHCASNLDVFYKKYFSMSLLTWVSFLNVYYQREYTHDLWSTIISAMITTRPVNQRYWVAQEHYRGLIPAMDYPYVFNNPSIPSTTMLALPDHAEINIADKSTIVLFHFISKYTKMFSKVLDQVTNLMDIYRMFARRSSCVPVRVQAYEGFIMEYIVPNTAFDIFYPLIMMAAFLRSYEQIYAGRLSVHHDYRLVYFKGVDEQKAPNDYASWSKLCSLAALKKQMDEWEDYYRTDVVDDPYTMTDEDNVSKPYVLSKINRIKNDMMRLHYEAYQNSFQGGSLIEQSNIHTSQPMLGFFFNLNRPFISHHIPMEFSPKDMPVMVDEFFKNKRNRQLQVGKASPAYLTYRTRIPLDVRVTKQDLDTYPVTPRPNTPKVPSRSLWNELVKRWRNRVRNWLPQWNNEEPEEFEVADLSSSSTSSHEVKYENDLRQWELYYYDLQQEEYKKSLQYVPNAHLTLLPNHIQAPLLGIEVIAEDLTHAREQEYLMNLMVNNLVQSSS